jgi:hypothetical protein
MIDKPAKIRRWTSSRQDLPGYEQKPRTRPTTPGDRAADREAEPEERAEVDQALGRGQIACLWSTLLTQDVPYLGRSQRVPVSRACPKVGADAVTHTVR